MKLLLRALLAAGVLLSGAAANADSPMSPARPLPKPANASPPSATGASSQAKPTADVAADTGIKPGKWQFISELAAASRSNGGAHATYESCIDATNALPAEFGPECQLQHVERKGAQIVWAMNCPGRHIGIDGVAHYYGDAMDATVVSHLPGSANAAAGTAVTQHITGHFLGACTREALRQPPPQSAPAGESAAAKGVPVAEASIEPPASAQQPAPVATTEIPQKAEVSPKTAVPEKKVRPRRHFARVSRHYRQYYAGWGFAGGYSGSAYSDRGRDY